MDTPSKKMTQALLKFANEILVDCRKKDQTLENLRNEIIANQKIADIVKNNKEIRDQVTAIQSRLI